MTVDLRELLERLDAGAREGADDAVPVPELSSRECAGVLRLVSPSAPAPLSRPAINTGGAAADGSERVSSAGPRVGASLGSALPTGVPQPPASGFPRRASP